MSDYSFMRSGIGSPIQQQDVDAAQMQATLIALLHCLIRRAMLSAARFARVCGRTSVCKHDIIRALQYQARTFFDLGEELDAEFRASLENPQASLASINAIVATPHDDDAPFTCELTSTCGLDDRVFYNDVQKYHLEWDDWAPTDPLVFILKQSIDKTIAQST